jgi:hypothetical protein
MGGAKGASMSISNRKLSAIFTKLAQAGVKLREVGEIRAAIDCFDALAMDDETYENGDYAYHLAECYRLLGEEDKYLSFMRIAHKNNPALYDDSD